MVVQGETLRKIQLCELMCLKEIKRICEKNSIPYFLIGGTLIGAVRHKGFIPWDDDIDVGMLRKDYDRFLEIAPTEIDKETFFLQTPETEDNCYDYEIARVRLNNTHFIQKHRKNLNLHNGFFAEIIPYDDLPNTNLKCVLYSKYFRFMKKLVGYRGGYEYEVTSKKVKKIIFLILVNLSKIIPFKVLDNKMRNYHKKYYNTNSEKVFLLAGAYNYKRESHLRKTVSEFTELQFEDDTFKVPKEYDMFLREQYGDYMQLPPAEKQIGKLTVVDLDFGKYSN